METTTPSFHKKIESEYEKDTYDNIEFLRIIVEQMFQDRNSIDKNKFENELRRIIKQQIFRFEWKDCPIYWGD